MTPTLSDAITLYQQYQSTGNYSANSIANYGCALHILDRFLADPELTAITAENLQSFMVFVKDSGRKEATRLYYWRVLRSFYNWADPRYQTGRPDHELSKPKAAPVELIPYTQDDVKKLIIACDKTHNPARNRLMIYLLLDTGLRVSELCAVQYGDVDIDDGSIMMHASGSGVKSRPRKVYMGARTINILYPFVSAHPEPEKHLITTGAGNPINRYTARSTLRRLVENSGVKNGGAHRFRHTFAVEFLRNGGDIHALRELLGHTSLDMSVRYLGIAGIRAKEAHAKASPVDNWRI